MAGIAFCTIEYEFIDKRYRAVHGVATVAGLAPGSNTFTEADAILWGFDELSFGTIDADTNPFVPTAGGATLLHSIIAFHRGMQSPLVRIKQLYLHDGATPGIATGAFAVFNLDLPCLNSRLADNAAQIEPANTALLIDKSSGTFGRKGGRIWMRGALNKADTVAAAQDGVSLSPLGASLAQEDVLAAMNNGGGAGETRLAGYLNDGISGVGSIATVMYVIPRTKAVTTQTPTGPKVSRVLDGATQCNTLAVDDAQSRDTRRRKKKAA